MRRMEGVNRRHPQRFPSMSARHGANVSWLRSSSSLLQFSLPGGLERAKA